MAERDQSSFGDARVAVGDFERIAATVDELDAEREPALVNHLPGPIAAQVLRAAQEAYVNGMSEVLLVTAGMMLVGSVLMAIFMPARAAAADAGDLRLAGVAS